MICGFGLGEFTEGFIQVHNCFSFDTEMIVKNEGHIESGDLTSLCLRADKGASAEKGK